MLENAAEGRTGGKDVWFSGVRETINSTERANNVNATVGGILKMSDVAVGSSSGVAA